MHDVQAPPTQNAADRNQFAPVYCGDTQLLFPVCVDNPDPTFGKMLLEQFGGPNGTLAAAVQYSIQGLNCDNPHQALLIEIAGEELSHLDIVGALASCHLKPTLFQRFAMPDAFKAITRSRSLHSATGHPWTTAYLETTGHPDVDLRSNIAAESRARAVYQRLLDVATDASTRDALNFLIARETRHIGAFAAALESFRQDDL